MQKQTCFFRLLTEISINSTSKCWLNLQFFTLIKRPITNIPRNFEGWFNFNFYRQDTAYDADWMNNNTKFHHCEIKKTNCRNKSFQTYFWIYLKMYLHSNPQLNACIILLRNNDAKTEKRFAFEISSLWVECRALRSSTALKK